MDKRKAESFIPEVKKILGNGYDVSLAVVSGSVLVKKGKPVVFRIFYSINETGFIVRLDAKSSRDIAKKVADDLKIKFVE